MENKIWDILENVRQGYITVNDGTQQVLDLFAVIKSVCVHPYEKVYQSETECYCEICGHDFTEQTVL
jgi:hypothetical protein